MKTGANASEGETTRPSAVDRYAVLGNPVAHSRSPFIHHLFAQQTGQPVHYERLHCEMDGFEAAVRRFAAEGGRGCNVTVPFKFQVPQLAQRCTARAELAGAANVLSFEPTGWLADNTDGVGLVRDIQQGAGVLLRGSRVLLVGAGGAGAGVLGPLLAEQPVRVVVANRSVGKADALVARHALFATQHRAHLLACGLHEAFVAAGVPIPGKRPPRRYDVVINASASSLQGATSPVAADVLGPGCLAIDLMYGPAAAPWLAWAQAHGAQVRDGLGMLVEQAAEAFALWRGVQPQTAPVLQALRDEIAAGR